MNPTPVLQVSAHLAVSPSASAGAPGANGSDSAKASENGPTFAGALKDAGAKPARKSAAAKPADDGRPGEGLPVAGNHSPPAPAPLPPPVPVAVAAPIAAPVKGIAADASARPATGVKAAVVTAGVGVKDGAVTALASGEDQVAHPAMAAPVAGAAPASTKDGTAAMVSSGSDGVSAAAAGTPKLAAAFNSLLGRSGTGAATAASEPAAASTSTPAQPPVILTPPSAPLTTATAAPAVASAAAATTASAPTTQSASTAAAAKTSAKAPNVAAVRPGAKTAARDPGTEGIAKSAVAGGSEADSAVSGTAATSGGAAQAGATSATLSADGAAAAPTSAAPSVAVTAAVAAAAAATAAAPAAPQSTDSAVVVANDSPDSDAAVGAPGAAGTSAAAGASATALSLSHATAGALAAQSRLNPSQVDDSDKRTHAESGISAGGNTGDAAAGLSQLSSNPPVSAPDAAPTPTLRVHASVDSSDFAQGLSDRVSWMVDNSVNGAKLQVNPPQLGPIELRISVQGDHAQVWMTTHSAVTRDALESSSPKLREMLGAQGFGQVSVDISQRSFQDRSAYTPPPYERVSSADRSVAAPAVSTIAATAQRSSQGALDAYA